MSKYIAEECQGCDEYIEPYGCTDHGCEIYQEYQAGREEMAADEEHDRRKDDRIERGYSEGI